MMSNGIRFTVRLAIGVAALCWIGASASADESATVTVTPPSVVEGNDAVRARNLANPMQEIWTYGTLLRDNVGMPEFLGGMVNILDEELSGGGESDGDATAGLERGWDAGGASFVWPPDCNIAVSFNQVVTVNNARFKYWNKDGTQLFTSSTSRYFDGVGGQSSEFDPLVLFDHETERWFIILIGLRRSDMRSWFLIAVSEGKNPNKGVWKKWAIDSTNNGGQEGAGWSDFPRAGLTSEALFISANMFSRQSGFFLHSKLRVIPKQQLLDFEDTITFTDIWNITNPNGSLAFTMTPAQTWGTPPAPLIVASNPSNKLTFFGVQDPLGNPTLVKRSVTVENYSPPPDADQKDGSPLLDTVDRRIWNAVWRNDSLWFALNTRGNGEAAVRWYEFDTTAWPSAPTLKQSGDVTKASLNFWFPSVAVNKNGTMAIGFCRAGPNTYASISYAYRDTDTPQGELVGPTSIKKGERRYTGEGGSPVRWGDYSGTVVDPADDETFWHYNEFPSPTASGSWKSWVQEFTTPPPGTNATISIDSTPIQFVSITISPKDLNGKGNGLTPMERTWSESTQVSLTAPAEAGGFFFAEWRLGGEKVTENLLLQFEIAGDADAQAVFVARRTLDISSSPDPAALIQISPADANGQSDGTTPFQRTYNDRTKVTMTAPATHGGKTFQRWRVNDADRPLGQKAVDLVVDADSTAVAVYGEGQGCQPCDTNCDGSVDLIDVAPFIKLLLGGDPPCDTCAGDANGDGSVNLEDVEDFIICLF